MVLEPLEDPLDTLALVPVGDALSLRGLHPAVVQADDLPVGVEYGAPDDPALVSVQYWSTSSST